MMIEKFQNNIFNINKTTYIFIFLITFIALFYVTLLTATSYGENNVSSSFSPTKKIILQNVSYIKGIRHLVAVVDAPQGLVIKIKVTDTSNKPVQGISVHFRIISLPEEARHQKLSSKIVKSDKNGVASVIFFPGNKSGDYIVSSYCIESNVTPLAVVVKVIDNNWVAVLLMGLLGGVGMFLYGMTLGSKGLQKAAGSQMRAILGKLTENRFLGMIIGTLTSAILQSSSATTVLIVSLVSATLLTLQQALGVVIGANIGTAITIHLIAFKITNYALLMIGLGFLLRMISNQKRMWHIGQIIMGFGFVFYGMHVMSIAVEPLKTFPQFSQIIISLVNYPLLVLFLAFIFTAIIQSSGVTIGLTIVLAREGMVGLDIAVPIIIGAHIGTTSTALIASLNSNLDGKRVAVFHFIFNVFGAIIFYLIKNPFISFTTSFTSTYISNSMPRMIANANMFFVMGTSLVFIFLTGPISVVLNKIIAEPKSKKAYRFKPKYLTNSLLGTPELALDHSLREILRMASFVDVMLEYALDLIKRKDEELALKIIEMDDKVDILEDALRHYLAAFTNRDITNEQSNHAIALLYIADDIEHIGDVIEVGIVSHAKKILDNNIIFSNEGLKELEMFHKEIMKTFRTVVMAIRKEDRKIASYVLDVKSNISILERELRDSHMNRLLKGKPESIESGTIHMDLLTEMKRISSLCSKIAHTIIEDF